MKRLFIAVPFKAENKTLEVLDALKRVFRLESINWVRPENLHLTLQFLGDTPDNLIPEIVTFLAQVAGKYTKTTGRIKGINYFTHRGYPKVIYSEIKGVPLLAEIANIIHSDMHSLGFTPDYKEFKSHLTFGRIKLLNDLNNFRRIIGEFTEKPDQSFEMSEIILYQSTLTTKGPVYAPIEKFILR